MYLGFLDESGGMVGAEASVVIPQYYIIVRYDLKGYSDQAALPEHHQTLMDASVEDVDDDIVLKFKNFLVEEGGEALSSMVSRTLSVHLMTLLMRDMAQSVANILLILARVEPQKFLIPIKASGYLMASCQAWHGDF